MKNSLSKVIVFGATSDIAQNAVRQLVEQGADVCCVARDPVRLDILLADLRVRAFNGQSIQGLAADLSDIDNIDLLWEQAKERLGGCDGVLIAQGVLPNQKECQQSIQQTLTVFNINTLGVIGLLTAISNDFEKQKKGVIAVITSVAGDRGRQSNYIYGASKGALSIFLQGLRNRLFQHGVTVLDIRPGFTRTRMTEGMDRQGFLWADADKVALGIVKSMRHGKDVVYLKWVWCWIMLIIKHIPETVFKRLSL